MDNLRLILFVALAFVLLLIWQAWEADYGRRPVSSPQTAAPPQAAPPHAAAEVPTPPGSAEIAPAASAAAPTTEERVHVATDVMEVTIGSRGGDILETKLLRYPVSSGRRDTPFTLMSDNEKKYFIAQSGLLGPFGAPTHREVMTQNKSDYRLQPGTKDLTVPLAWTSPEGVRVQKVYTFYRNSYVIDVAYRVENASTQTWRARAYGQLQRSDWVDQEQSSFIRTFTGAAIHTAQERYRKIGFPEMAAQPITADSQGGWVAMIQHYFVNAWVPPQDTSNHFYARGLQGGRYLAGVMTPEVSVAPGQSGTLGLRFYAGPKLQDQLQQVAPGLELTVDYGVFWFLSQPLFWALEHIHDLAGNWGWAIIILTVLIKLAFFHLSATSYKSMARMRKLQPRLMELKERYGDDRQRMSQAMMEIYKREKVNPLGGCLPIVVQIPVFIALYWVLVESVELRQAPFILWIRDLSDPDPFFVLPLIMGATMLLQQRLNPAPMDPLQQKVMMVLPIVFTVFFAFFPAGLVLYWATNNALSIAQQWYITRRIEQAR